MRHALRIGFLVVLTGLPACGSDDPSDSTPPQVRIDSPAAGVVSGQVTLSVSATDNHSVRYVRFRVNSGFVNFVDSTPPYAYVWDTSLFAAGFYDWEALATDAAGNTGLSPAVEYTVEP